MYMRRFIRLMAIKIKTLRTDHEDCWQSVSSNQSQNILWRLLFRNIHELRSRQGLHRVSNQAVKMGVENPSGALSYPQFQEKHKIVDKCSS